MAARTNRELLRSQEYADRMRRIAPLAAAAKAAKLADRAAYRETPVANLEPRDRRTREYREWAARQAHVR